MRSHKLDNFLVTGLLLWCAYSFYMVWRLSQVLITSTNSARQSYFAGGLIFFLVLSALAMKGASWMMRHRVDYYPAPGLDKRGFVTSFLYGRVLTWAETLYKLPKKIAPNLASGFVIGTWLAPSLFVYNLIDSSQPGQGAPTAWFATSLFSNLYIGASAVIAAIVLFQLMWSEYVAKVSPEGALEGGPSPESHE
jgi:hypothetical protein